MGRQTKRVAASFPWPIGKIWEGFENPHWKSSSKCPHCDNGSSEEARKLSEMWYGYGGFKPEMKGSQPWQPTEPSIARQAERNSGGPGLAADREARRLCDYYNAGWSHHLAQDEVDALIKAGRLHGLRSDFIPGKGWVEKPGGARVLAVDVNRWSLDGMAHDSINNWVVVGHVCEANGWPTMCKLCEGEGRAWESAQAKLDYEAWEPSEPPTGPWWQVWETVSEGSPVSPAFEDPEELARWLAGNRSGSIDEGTSAQQWLEFIMGPGWAPSMVMSRSAGVMSGVKALAREGA